MSHIGSGACDTSLSDETENWKSNKPSLHSLLGVLMAVSPEGDDHAEGEKAHEKVSNSEDVGRDGERDICLDYQPQLQSKRKA